MPPGTTASRTERAFNLDILEGTQPGHRLIRRFGFNKAVPDEFTDISQLGVNRIQPSAAAVVSLVSTSATDTAAGTGARTAKLRGLDDNYLEIEETGIALNGTTPVVSTKLFFRLHDVEIETAGITGGNFGDITASISGDDQMQMRGEASGAAPFGFNLIQDVGYTVPAGHAAYLTDPLTGGVGSNKECEFRILRRRLGELWHTLPLAFSFETSFEKNINYSYGFSEKTDINFQACNTSAIPPDPEVLIDYTLTLIKYDGQVPVL